jgi:hypothetical protein
MYKDSETLVSLSGLRYTSKENGSPYQSIGGTGETLSCIKCGKHRLKRNGMFKRYLNAPLFFCFDCKPNKIATTVTVGAAPVHS